MIYRTHVRVTIFSTKPPHPVTTEQNLKDEVGLWSDGETRYVADVTACDTAELTDDRGRDELWTFGFDPSVLDREDSCVEELP